MINLTAVIDNDEAIRKLNELKATAKNTTSSIVTDADRMDVAMTKFTSTLAKLGLGVSFTALSKQVADVRGQFQQLEVAFNTMLQSEEKASALLDQLTQTAAVTPFGLQDVASGAKQLLAYGASADKVNETLVRLGDIAAGLSIPLGDLVYLYGTTMTQGRLYSQDFNQFLGRGIPLADELAKQFGVTKSQVKSLVTEGKIGFEQVEKAIVSMTNKGGKFGGLMQEQSKTITGQISNLEDAIDMMFNEIGKQSEGAISGTIKLTATLVENYDKVAKVLGVLVATYGSYRTAVILTAVAEKLSAKVKDQMAVQLALMGGRMRGLTKAQLAQLSINKLLTASWKAMSASVIATSKALLASPVTWVTAALAGLSYVIYSVVTAETAQEKAQRKVNDSLEDYKAKQEELKIKAEELHGIMKDDATTAYQQEKAYRELIKAYPELLDKYSKEKILLMDIVALRKEIAGITDTRDRATAEANYKKALENYNYYNEEVDVENIGPGGVRTKTRQARSSVAANAALLEAEQWKQVLKEIDSIQAENASTNDKIAQKQAEINKLKEEEKRIDQDIADAKKSASSDGTTKTLIPSSKSENVLQTQKQSNIDRQKQLELEIKNLKEGQKVNNTPLSDEEKKRLKRIAEINEKLEKEAAQAQIDAMKEGTAKKLAQIDFEYNQREAEIKKREEELKALQGGKLTDEQTVAFGAMHTSNAYQRKAARMDAMFVPMDIDLASTWDDEQQALRDYLKEFGTYQEKLQAMVDEYDLQMQSATADGQRAAIQAERDAALAEMEVRASEFSDEIIALSTEKLNSLADNLALALEEAEQAYGSMDSSDSDDAKALRKKINVLQAKIKVLQQQQKVREKEDDAKDKNAEDKAASWFELQDVLSDLGKGFAELGEEIGGVTGHVIASAGNIATSAASMVGNIGMLVKMTTKGVEETADKGSKAIQAAERASVILAIIQAAIKVVTALVKLFGKGADYSDYNALKEKYDRLNEVWDELIEKKETYINMSYGAEAKKVGEEAIAIVNQQIEAYRELGIARLNAGTSAGSHSIGKRIQKSMSAEGWAQLRAAAADLGFDYDSVAGGRMTGLFELSIEQLEELKEKAPSFWAQLDSEVQDYLNKIIEGQAKIEELQNAYKEQLTQVSFDSVFDSFIDTLMDMDASAEEFSKNFSEYMMRAILTTQIGEAYKERLQKWYDDFAKANDDSDVTTDEINRLRSEWDAMVQEALALRDGIADITGYGDEMAQGQEATAKGFQTMDQETGSELNGRFTDMQGKMAEQLGLSREALERIEYIRNLSEQQLHMQIDMRDILIQMAGNVAEIKMNSDMLPQIHDAVSRTNKLLEEKL